MLNANRNPDLANELRYALDVLEENGHLGLDDEAASKIRSILVRRISQAEQTVSSTPGAPVRFLAEEKVRA